MKISIKAGLLSIGLLSPMLSPSVSFAESEVYKYWAVACNNHQRCEAVSLLFEESFSSDDSFTASVGVIRGENPNDQPSFRVLYGWETEPRFRVGDAIVLTAGSETLDLGKATRKHLEQLDIPADKSSEFLAMIRNPSVLKIKIGTQEFKASLQGLSAALLYMDEKQKRLDTPSALVRKGKKDMPTFTKPEPLQAVKAPLDIEPPKDLAKKIRGLVAEQIKEGCDADIDPSFGDFSDVLDKDTYIVGLGCFLAAYNTSAVLYRVKAETAESDKPEFSAIKLPTLDEEILEVPGANFNNGILSSFSKGRGLGDCGAASEWVWTKKGFKLINNSEMPVCRGVPEFLNDWKLDYNF